jgi:hypothetical protein
VREREGRPRPSGAPSAMDHQHSGSSSPLKPHHYHGAGNTKEREGWTGRRVVQSPINGISESDRRAKSKEERAASVIQAAGDEWRGGWCSFDVVVDSTIEFETRAPPRHPTHQQMSDSAKASH